MSTKVEKVKVTRVSLTDKNKDGTACMVNGKPVKRMGIITDRYGDKKWLSYTIWNDKSKELTIKEGSEIEIIVTERGDFKNFRLATDKDRMQEQIDDLKVRMARMENTVYYSNPGEKAKEPVSEIGARAAAAGESDFPDFE